MTDWTKADLEQNERINTLTHMAHKHNNLEQDLNALKEMVSELSRQISVMKDAFKKNDLAARVAKLEHK